MILIHTALLCEAQSFIEYYKLKKTNSNPKIYSNDKIVLIITGVGKDNTLNGLNYIFKNFKILKAVNIGIAGCNNSDTPIGKLFCTNHNLEDIECCILKTVDNPTIAATANISIIENTTLYDMEGDYFLDYTLSKLSLNDIYIFKIVSDYLEDKILPKDYIKSIINKQKEQIIKYIDRNSLSIKI